MKRVFKVVKNMLFSGMMFFAVGTVLHFFVFEMYYVPSESMDQTIKPGEYILANKLAYGARWFTSKKVNRIYGFSHIQRNDIVVFNFPEGDTVYRNEPLINYYQIKRKVAYGNDVPDYIRLQEKVYLPISQRVAYVKRCIGIPGDTLVVKNGEVYINTKLSRESLSVKKKYRIKGDVNEISELLKEFGIQTFWESKYADSIVVAVANLSDINRWSMQNKLFTVQQAYENYYRANIFPFNKNKNKAWRYDAYGPLYIPGKGDEILLNESNLPLYERIIRVYEGNDLKIRDGNFFINGIKTNKYIIQQNYYFMMGDNRSFSVDSRSWGFVPEDHIIGKASFVLFSHDKKEQIRWERIGRFLK